MNKDSYFRCLAIDELHVQTLGHLTAFREQCDLLPSAEEVNESFIVHEHSLDNMISVCDALKSAATEWRATLRAVEKAKSLEQKAMDAERKRLERKELAAEKKKQKAADALQKAKEAKQHAMEAKAEADEATGGRSKKRRIASRLTGELTEDDPAVLLSRFPKHQIQVVESLDTCRHYCSCSI